MSVEYCVTFGDHRPYDDAPPAPSPPEGEGWEIVAMAATRDKSGRWNGGSEDGFESEPDTRLYWTWRR